MPRSELKLDGRIVKHDTKSQTKQGVSMLKVTALVSCSIGAEAVETPVTWAVRTDKIDDYPIDHALQITIGPATK